MHLTAKLTMNCLQHLRVKSLASALPVYGCCHQMKKNFSVQNLHYSSRKVSDQRQNPLIQSGNCTAKDAFGSSLPFPRKLSNVSEKTGMKKNIPAISVKKRVPRKKSVIGSEQVSQEKWLVVAYCSAEEYNLSILEKEIQKQGLYKILPFPVDADEVLHVTANYQVGKEPRHIYFFSEGSVVFWNVPDLEQQAVLKFLKPFQVNAYGENLFEEEREHLEYSYAENGARLSNGLIILNDRMNSEGLETYAFSNAIALSVKLAMSEAALEKFVESVEWVTENMKHGKKINMSRRQVLQKRGELFSLRDVVNLRTDMLDTPDFYWDREDLEILYKKTCNHLNIDKRTKVLNERLNYCSELIDLLGNHMNDKHHVRLELMIIALIMIEVMFECAHFFGKMLKEENVD